MSNANYNAGEAANDTLTITLNYLQCQMTLLTKIGAPTLPEAVLVPDFALDVIAGEGHKTIPCEVFSIQVPSFPDDTFIAVSPSGFDAALSQAEEGDVLIVPFLTGQSCAATPRGGQKGRQSLP